VLTHQLCWIQHLIIMSHFMVIIKAIFWPKKGPKKWPLFKTLENLWFFRPYCYMFVHYNQNCRRHGFVLMVPILWSVNLCAYRKYVVNLAPCFSMLMFAVSPLLVVVFYAPLYDSLLVYFVFFFFCLLYNIYLAMVRHLGHVFCTTSGNALRTHA
jgi:hypothetical protein